MSAEFPVSLLLQALEIVLAVPYFDPMCFMSEACEALIPVA
jgi:hypothetical protein